MTPAPVPGAQYPPGVTTAGLDDPTALIAAHSEVLHGTSARIVTEKTVTLPNGTRVSRERKTVLLGPNWSRSVVTVSRERPGAPDRRSVSFTDGTVSFRRTTTGTGTRHSRDDSPDDVPARAVPGRAADLLRGFEGSTVSMTDETPARIRIEGTFGVGVSTMGFGQVTNATAMAIVDSEGLVHRIRVSYDTENPRAGERVRIVERVAVHDVGSTTVPAPEWVDDQPAATGPER